MGWYEEPRATSCGQWAVQPEQGGCETECHVCAVGSASDALPIGEAAEDSARHALASARRRV